MGPRSNPLMQLGQHQSESLVGRLANLHVRPSIVRLLRDYQQCVRFSWKNGTQSKNNLTSAGRGGRRYCGEFDDGLKGGHCRFRLTSR
eukprot:scaffold390822_cov79-Cyclotella_meneghiniana.AAC.4